MHRARGLVSIAVACLLTASGCKLGAGLSPPPRKPVATKQPATGGGPLGITGLPTRAVPQTGDRTTLSGKARIIGLTRFGLSQGGAIISDHGSGLISESKGAIISDNGGGIISNNSGSIISNNSGSIVSDQGSGLVSGAGKRNRLLAADEPPLALFGLADAGLTLHDAEGRVLVDAAGKPLMATTGPDGRYSLTAVLPPGNLVAHIHLYNGGDLEAMVTRDAAGSLDVDLDTATTIGAAYVLGNFVKGDQTIFDKLPRAANDKLTHELDVVRVYVKAAFKYDASLLVEAADALRKREPTVDATIDEVKALLLGQARIGAGRRATEVPLTSIAGMAVDREGGLLIGENFLGRLRRVTPSGLMETILDDRFGRIRRAFPGLTDLVEGPDGAFYINTTRTRQIFRVTEAGDIAVYAGSDTSGNQVLKGPKDSAMSPSTFTFGPDGTLYIGEWHGSGTLGNQPTRVLAVSPEGTLRVVAAPAWANYDVNALVAGPGDALYAYVGQSFTNDSGEVWRLSPGEPTPLIQGLTPGTGSDMVRGTTGELIVSEAGKGRVFALSPTDGTTRAVAGVGASAATAALVAPGQLAIAADGTLYIADGATNLIGALGPDGAFRPIAGTQEAFQSGDSAAFAINAPGGVTFDAEGRILVADGGSSTIKRYDGKGLEVVVGTSKGYGGDGGPAANARLSAPTGIAFVDGVLWIVDAGNRCLRRVDPAGRITTVAGSTTGVETVQPGQPAANFSFAAGLGLTIGPDGLPYIACSNTGQVVRVRGDAVEFVTGAVHPDVASADDVVGGLFSPDEPDPGKVMLSYPIGLAFDPAAASPSLCVSEGGGLRIRMVTGLAAGGAPMMHVIAGLSLNDALERLNALDPDAPPPPRVGALATEVALFIPTGIAYDPAGNLYVAEAGTRSGPTWATLFGANFPLGEDVLPASDARILKIDREGRLSVIAGPEGKFFTDPNAEDALVVPTGVAIAPDGRMVITDPGANLIRILPAGTY